MVFCTYFRNNTTTASRLRSNIPALSLFSLLNSVFLKNLNFTLFSFKCLDTGLPFPHFILISYLKFVGIFHQSRLILSQGCAPPSEELTKIVRLEWLQIFAMWKHYVSHVFKYHLFYIMWFPNSHLQLWSFPWLSDLHVQWPNWHLFLDVSKAFRDQLNVPIGKRLTVPNPVPLLHSSSFLFKWTSHSKQNLPVPFGNKWEPPYPHPICSS